MSRNQARLIPFPCKASARSDASGFTYIGLLILIAIMGVTLVITGTLWHTAQQREKEQRLLFVGNQFSRAITAYYQQTFNEIHQFPKRLEDLLLDKRYPNTTRYLRRIFADPFTGTTQWGLIRGADGGIVGVHSLSDAAPFKTDNFGRENESFAKKTHVSDWQFVYRGTVISQPVASAQPANDVPPAYRVPPAPPLPADAPIDQRKANQCQLMYGSEATICANVAAKFGDAAGMTCMASATARHAICMSGDAGLPMPVLAVQYQ